MKYNVLVLDRNAEALLTQKGLNQNPDVMIETFQVGYSERAVAAGVIDAVFYSNLEGRKLAQTLGLDEHRIPNLVLSTDRALNLGRESFETNVSESEEGQQIVTDIALIVEKSWGEKEKVGKSLLLEMINDISGSSTTNSPSQFIERGLEAIDKYFSPKAVYFMYAGEFDFYVRQMWKVQSISGKDFVQQPEFISYNGQTTSDMSDLLQKIQGVLEVCWEMKRTYTRLPGGHEVTDNTVVVPVFREHSSDVIGHFFVVSPSDWPFAKESVAIEYFSRFFGFGLGYSEKLESAKELTYVDDLTELYNQRYLKFVLDKEIDRAKRSSTPFSILFIDLDHFKRVNDTEGHLVGSSVLVQVGKLLGRSIRNTDYGFRYGGDEFMLLMIGMDAAEAGEVAERIRENVEASVFRVQDIEVKVTLSIGVASYPEHAQDRDEIIRMADEAMYKGKHKSRNVVFVAS